MDKEKLNLPGYDIPEDMEHAIAVTTLDRFTTGAGVHPCGRSCSAWHVVPSK